jgi:hypothetical protein
MGIFFKHFLLNIFNWIERISEWSNANCFSLGLFCYCSRSNHHWTEQRKERRATRQQSRKKRSLSKHIRVSQIFGDSLYCCIRITEPFCRNEVSQVNVNGNWFESDNFFPTALFPWWWWWCKWNNWFRLRDNFKVHWFPDEVLRAGIIFKIQCLSKLTCFYAKTSWKWFFHRHICDFEIVKLASKERESLNWNYQKGLEWHESLIFNYKWKTPKAVQGAWVSNETNGS